MWFSDDGTMEAPQSAHEILLWEPGIIDCRDELVLSRRRAVNAMGSIVSCPVWIADKTERRDSQFKDGAKSKRRVGSLISQNTFSQGVKVLDE